MIRFRLAMLTFLLGFLIVPPQAPAQEPSKEGSAAGTTADKPDPAAEARLKAVSLDDLAYVQSYFRLSEAQPKQPKAPAKLFDALETNFGLSLSDADDTLRSQLEIPSGQGVVVVGVKAGSLAEHAGLKTNDVLLSLGDETAKESHQVRDVLLGLGRQALEVKLIREGKASRMSLVGPEHGFPPEAAEYWIGVPVSPVDATLRTHLPTLPADSGLIVNDVVKGSPADLLAVKKDDILVAMDGKPLKNSDALIAQIQASQGKPVPLQLLRGGKPLTLTITPAKRAHPTVINWRKTPENLFTYQVVRPNLAIEVEPGLVQKQVVQEKAVESKNFPQGSFTLFTPYSGVVLNPYAGLQTTQSFPNYLNQPTPFPSTAITDPATARIEGQLIEIKAKLEEIAKTLEGLKKSAGK